MAAGHGPQGAGGRGVRRLAAVRPIDHFNGFHTFFADISSGEGIAPYKTVKDYENGLGRFDDFVRLADNAIARMEQGLAAGIVQPKLVMDQRPRAARRDARRRVEGSSFYRPSRLPRRGTGSGPGRGCAAYGESISTEVGPR
jgi:uncharacterized protein (DUF885 family)